LKQKSLPVIIAFTLYSPTGCQLLTRALFLDIELVLSVPTRHCCRPG